MTPCWWIRRRPCCAPRGAEPFDLILMDLNYARDTTSGAEGLDLLSSLEAQKNAAPMIVMTAWGNVELAVEAMRRGACDFVQKPWDNARLLGTIRKQADEAVAKMKADRQVKSELEIARNVQQKLVSAPERRLPSHRLRRPVRAGAGSQRRLLRFSGHRRQRPGICAGGCFRKRRGGSVADGQSASLLPQPVAGCAAAAGFSMLRAVNKLFYESTPPEHFATLFFGNYDDRSRRLRYVNCGHLPPILIRADAKCGAAACLRLRYWVCSATGAARNAPWISRRAIRWFSSPME